MLNLIGAYSNMSEDDKLKVMTILLDSKYRIAAEELNNLRNLKPYNKKILDDCPEIFSYSATVMDVAFAGLIDSAIFDQIMQ